jgi:3D (Asp-Asp-Asp) domain-containing protein
MKEDKFDFATPSEHEMKTKLSLWATHYYVHKAKAVDDGEPLLDTSGQALGPKLPAREWCLAAIEGTAGIEAPDGKTTIYNYAGVGADMQVDCGKFFPKFAASGKLRWKLAEGPFGDGVHGMVLVPFRTIAVDGRQNPIPYRSLIYIPAARGVIVYPPSTPGKTYLHDGYFYAGDTGGAIKDTHIDVFGGMSSCNPFPNFVRNSKSYPFDAYFIENERISLSLDKLHGRGSAVR